MNARIEDAAWDCFIVFACVFLLGALLFGCSSPEPPSMFSIDPEFRADKQAIIHDAVAAWCEAVDYCPEEQPWAEWPIQEGAIRSVGGVHFTHIKGLHAGEWRGGHNDGWSITVDRDLVPAFLWLAVAHEIGHYCIKRHLSQGLMSAVVDQDMPLQIDDAAIEAWHDGCG